MTAWRVSRCLSAVKGFGEDFKPECYSWWRASSVQYFREGRQGCDEDMVVWLNASTYYRFDKFTTSW